MMCGLVKPVFRLPYVPLSKEQRQKGAKLLEAVAEHLPGVKVGGLLGAGAPARLCVCWGAVGGGSLAFARHSAVGRSSGQMSLGHCEAERSVQHVKSWNGASASGGRIFGRIREAPPRCLASAGNSRHGGL